MDKRAKLTKFIRLHGGFVYPILKKAHHQRIIQQMHKEEIHKSFGEKNPDKVFYIVKRDLDREGLMSYANNFLGHIVYASEQGWIPVVDMQNYRNTYLEEVEFGKKNAWEFFFKQPTKYSLEEAYQSKNVVISNGQPSPFRLVDEDGDLLEEWHVNWQEYIHFADEAQKIMDREFRRIIREGDKVLGVNVRGTDYVSLNQRGLPIQPDIETLMKEAENWMEKYGLNKLFLSCEDEEIVQRFQDRFSNKVILNQREFYRKTAGEEVVTDITFHRENDKYLRGIEYLTTIYILSKCDYLLGGVSGASVSAQCMRPLDKPYKKVYLYKLGQIQG